jgi:hypothetical protein
MAIVTTYQRAFNTSRLDPYPLETLKRRDRPTTVIKGDKKHSARQEIRRLG